MTTENKEPLAVIETLVKALEASLRWHQGDKYRNGKPQQQDVWKGHRDELQTALTEARAFMQGRGEVQHDLSTLLDRALANDVATRKNLDLPEPTSVPGPDANRVAILLHEAIAALLGSNSKALPMIHLARRIVCGYTIEGDPPLHATHPQATQPAPSTAGEHEPENEPGVSLASVAAQPADGSPLPCPFCGHIGLEFREGSTFRWIIPECGGCGATRGETRIQTFGEGTRDEWMAEARADAIRDWNKRAALLSAQALPAGELTDEQIDKITEKYTLHKTVERDWYGESYTESANDLWGARKFARAILAAARTQPELVPLLCEHGIGTGIRCHKCAK